MTAHERYDYKKHRYIEIKPNMQTRIDPETGVRYPVLPYLAGLIPEYFASLKLEIGDEAQYLSDACDCIHDTFPEAIECRNQRFGAEDMDAVVAIFVKGIFDSVIPDNRGAEPEPEQQGKLL